MAVCFTQLFLSPKTNENSWAMHGVEQSSLTTDIYVVLKQNKNQAPIFNVKN